MHDFDVVIIGAGVVGLAIAYELCHCGKNRSILVIEKNLKYGQETSSRNSEVIHAGVYYPKDSLKAKLCIEGRELMYRLCKEKNIWHRKITKLITCNNSSALSQLESVYSNGKNNNVPLRILSKSEVKILEPNVISEGGILSSETGIVSVSELMDFYYKSCLDKGVDFYFAANLIGIEKKSSNYSLALQEKNETVKISTKVVVNSAGLYSDKIAELAGIDIDKFNYRLNFCKGTYYKLRQVKQTLISRLIYPLPKNEGLGVHATVDLAGNVKFGPDVDYMSENKLDYSINEYKKNDFYESINEIIRGVKLDDIYPDYCGIRPKLQKKGGATCDFIIKEERDKNLEGFINLIGIESPGLTSSPAIGRYVLKLIESSL